MLTSMSLSLLRDAEEQERFLQDVMAQVQELTSNLEICKRNRTMFEGLTKHTKFS